MDGEEDPFQKGKKSFFDRLFLSLKVKCVYQSLMSGSTLAVTTSLAHFAFKGLPLKATMVFSGVFCGVTVSSILLCRIDEKKELVLAHQLQKANEYMSIYAGSEELREFMKK